MKLVASDIFGEAGSDWYLDEELFKTDDDSFILKGSGGKYTKYAGSSKEFHLTEEQALTWLEKHYDTLKLGKVK